MLLKPVRQWWIKRLIRRARKSFDSGDWQGAAELAEEAARMDVTDATARMLMGMAKFEARDYKGAVRCFTRVLRIDPDNAEAKGHLAMTYARSKRWDKAARTVEQLAEKPSIRPAAPPRPRAPETAMRPARARTPTEMIQQGDWRGLKARAQAVLAKDPSNPNSLLQLGMALYRMGRPEEALGAYDEALEAVKKQPDKAAPWGAVVSFNRSTVLMQLSRWREACQAFESLGALPAASRGKLREEAILYNLGYCYRRRKMIKMARSTYERLGRMNPSYKDVSLCLERLQVPLAADLPEPRNELGNSLCENCNTPLPLGASFCKQCGWAAVEDQELLTLQAERRPAFG